MSYFSGTLYLGTVTVDLSSADISGIYPTLDTSQPSLPSAHAEIIGGNTLDLSGVFWFKTDSIDISDNETQDLRFAYNKTLLDKRISMALGDIGNASDLTVKKSTDSNLLTDGNGNVVVGKACTHIGQAGFGDLGTTTIGNGGAHYHALPTGNSTATTKLKEDIARFMAFKITGGYSSSDIFDNEKELIDTIASHLDGTHPDSVGVVSRIENNLVHETSVNYQDKEQWTPSDSAGKYGRAPPPSDTDGSKESNQPNLTEAVIDYLRRNSNNTPRVDLGQYLVNQARHANTLGWADVSGISDISTNSTGNLGWCPITMDSARNGNASISIVLKLIFLNIGKQTHKNGNSIDDNPPLIAGGANEIGSRSYLVKFTDPGHTLTTPTGLTSGDNTDQ